MWIETRTVAGTGIAEMIGMSGTRVGQQSRVLCATHRPTWAAASNGRANSHRYFMARGDERWGSRVYN